MIKLPKVQSQGDSRWGAALLGNNTESKYNIANYGCLLACFSIACCYYGFETNPLDLNDNLKDVGGFTNGGDYIWSSIKKVTDKLSDVLIRVGDVYPVSDMQLEQIKDALDQGMPVILHIDYDPKDCDDDMHWVLAVGYNPNDDNDFTIADPVDGQLKSLKKYLGWFRPSMRSTVIDYVILVGETPQGTNLKEMDIDFDDQEGNRHTVGWYVYEWFNEKSAVFKEIDRYTTLEDSYNTYKKVTDAEIIDQNHMIGELQIHITDLMEIQEGSDDVIEALIEDTDYHIDTAIKLLTEAFKKWLIGILKGGADK